MWKCLIIIITWMHSNVSISSADYLAAVDNTVNGSSELKWHGLIPRSIPHLNDVPFSIGFIRKYHYAC